MDAVEKFRIIQPYLDKELSLEQVSNKDGIPIRTLRRWIKNYRAESLAGLTHKTRSDKGEHRKLPEMLEKHIIALALQRPKLSITTIQRQVARIAEQNQLNVPKYGTVYQVVRNLSPALMTLAHEGSVAYRDKYEIIFRRESKQANELWQIDHTPLDILLLDEKGIGQKPWLTIIQDDYSRAIMGYFLSFDAPCAVNTALALRQAIWRKSNEQWQCCGIPEQLYSDNGSDFTSEHIKKVCIALKIRTIKSIPGRPQGKGRIERFFLTLLRALLEQLEGYAPAGFSKVKAVLSLSDFQLKLEQFILTQYHQTPHRQTKQTPYERWLGKGFLPQLPESLEQLDRLLMSVPKKRKVHRDGIYFKQLRYMNTMFSDFVGEEVMIRYDPRDLAEIRVFYEEKFLCVAVCQDIADLVISLKDIKKARGKTRRELRQIIQQSKALLKGTPEEKETNKAPKARKKTKIKLYENE